jgi:hypothetical protein
MYLLKQNKHLNMMFVRITFPHGFPELEIHLQPLKLVEPLQQADADRRDGGPNCQAEDEKKDDQGCSLFNFKIQ